MACERNRILNCIKYIESCGVEVNMQKNKARGNKGIFMHKFNQFRIDISKLTDNNEILNILIHEFAHFVHYNYDNKMDNLNFAFGNINDSIRDELINVTVNAVPKKFAEDLFNEKNKINKNIKDYYNTLKSADKTFKLSSTSKMIESTLPTPVQYLLRYDNIKFINRIYTIKNLKNDFPNLTEIQTAYINLKSQQRKLKRINNKISRLNKYYNNSSELFARFVELYINDYQKLIKIAPNATNLFEKQLSNSDNKLAMISDLVNLINS